jgi:hypothetical protein
MLFGRWSKNDLNNTINQYPYSGRRIYTQNVSNKPSCRIVRKVGISPPENIKVIKKYVEKNLYPGKWRFVMAKASVDTQRTPIKVPTRVRKTEIFVA